MAMGRMLITAFLTCVCVISAWGGQCFHSPFPPALSRSEAIALAVPEGTTLQVALDKEVKVKKVGQPIHGRLIKGVYAFDREVIPVGSEVVGRITEIEGVSGPKRFLAALNLDFTPTRRVHVEFDEIILADGKHIPIKAAVTPGSGRAIQLITTVDKDKKKTSKDAVSEKMKEPIREAKRKWHSVMKQVKNPGKMRRLARFAVAQLPVHPQYIEAGTVYFVELKDSLDFGSKLLAPQSVTRKSAPLLPCNFLAHAQLVTPLSSATTQQDAPVEAILTQPLVSDGRLILRQGSQLKGSVVQVQPARRFGRNGKLRIVFGELVPLDGIQQKVVTNLEGVQAGKDQHMKLDTEGGAQSTSPKARYLFTGLTVALAVASYEDTDAEDGVTTDTGNASQGAAGGAAGFKLVGMVVGAFAHSRPLALGMGVYGVGRSAYSHFLTRGRDVVFPKGTAMEVGFSLRSNCYDSATPNSPEEAKRINGRTRIPFHW